MKLFFEAILFAVFIIALANSTDKSKCNVNNNYNSFYAGPNCKKIEQQLAEIQQEIRALKRNETRGSDGKGLYSLLHCKFHFTSLFFLPEISLV